MMVLLPRVRRIDVEFKESYLHLSMINTQHPLDSECEVSIRDAGRHGRSALPEKGITVSNEKLAVCTFLQSYSR